MKSLICIFVTITILVLVSGCGEDKRVEIPREKTSHLLKAFAYTDAGNPQLALDAVRYLEIIDPTDEFMADFERITLDNHYTFEAEKLLGAGRPHEALALLDSALVQYGDRLKNTLAAQGHLKTLVKTGDIIENLALARDSETIARYAATLDTLSDISPELAVFKPFAKRRAEDALKMAELEEEKSRFLLWCNAIDAERSGDYIERDLIVSMLTIMKYNDAVNDLRLDMYKLDRGGDSRPKTNNMK